MRKYLVMASALLATSIGTRAQDLASTQPAAPWEVVTADNAFADVSKTQSLFPSNQVSSRSSFLGSHDFLLVPALWLPLIPPALPAFASAKPANAQPLPRAPQKGSRASNVSDPRLELGVGFIYVRFRSTPFDVGLYGIESSATYFVRGSLGLEANFVGAFGPHLNSSNIQQTRIAEISGGPKFVWPKEGWRPWAHVLAGVAHVNPQVAAVSKNGVAIQLGGGVDIPLTAEFLWLRAEGDYVRSQLYNTGQNDFQFSLGFVFHLF